MLTATKFTDTDSFKKIYPKDIKIDNGSYGNIYSVKGKPYIIKEGTFEDLFREIDIGSRINNKQCIHAVAISYCDNLVQIVYPKGINFIDYCSVNRYKFKEITYMLLKGLRDFHQHGLCHNDIKPANIVVIEDIPVYIDFGLSRKCDLMVINDNSKDKIDNNDPEISKNECPDFWSSNESRAYSSATINTPYSPNISRSTSLYTFDIEDYTSSKSNASRNAEYRCEIGIAGSDTFDAPEPPYNFNSQLVDIYSLGKTFECMIEECQMITSNLPFKTQDDEFNEMLTHMICKENVRWSANQLLNHIYYTDLAMSNLEMDMINISTGETLKYNEINSELSRIESVIPQSITPRSVNKHNHYIISHWLIKTCSLYPQMDCRVLFLCLHNINRSWNIIHSMDDEMSCQSWAVANLYLASQLYPPSFSVKECIQICKISYTVPQFQKMLVLKLLKILNGIVDVTTYWNSCESGENLGMFLRAACHFSYPNVLTYKQSNVNVISKYMTISELYKDTIAASMVKSGNIDKFMGTVEISNKGSVTALMLKPVITTQNLIFLDDPLTIISESMKKGKLPRYCYILSILDLLKSNVGLANSILHFIVNAKGTYHKHKDIYDVIFGKKKLRALACRYLKDLRINCYTSSLESIVSALPSLTA